MEPVTLAIAAVAAFLMWRTTPIKALGIYFAVLLLYPQFLSAPIGTLDFNTGRILILVLFAKMALQTRLLQEFQWTNMDRLALVLFVAGIVTHSVNAPIALVLERQSGLFVSVLMPYFAIRAIVATKQDFLSLLRVFVFVGVTLAVLGVYQSVTGHNPMGFMKGYTASSTMEQRYLVRYGFYRADVSFGQYIAFGMFFTPLLALSLVLHKKGTDPARTLVVLIVLVLGVMSSVSSAPFLGCVVTLAVIAFFPFRKYTVATIGIMLASMVFLEYYSDRHFYEVMTRLAMNGKTAAYRIGLYEEAFGGGMDGHWLFGYGYVGLGPGNDNSNFLWRHQDLVNIYIARLARGGLFATVPFLMINVLYYRSLYRAWRLCKSVEDRWMVWCLSAALIGWNVAMMTVGTVSVLGTLLFALIALAGCMPRIVAEETEQDESPVSSENSLVLRPDDGAPGNSGQLYQDG